MPKPNDDQKDESSADSPAGDENDQKDHDDAADDGYGSGVKKRREGPDNLRRRSEWFQKRTGGGS